LQGGGPPDPENGKLKGQEGGEDRAIGGQGNKPSFEGKPSRKKEGGKKRPGRTGMDP